MSYYIGSINSANATAHKEFLELIKDEAPNDGWEVVRWDDSGPDWELILKGEGYTGTEEIYVGFKTYESATADFYNIACGVMTGYVAGNPFEVQPGIKITGCPAHNNAIDYFININPQRIVGCLKVGTPVYEHFYVGKFLPYARPTEFPYPVICAASLIDKAETRYSDTRHRFPYPGFYENVRNTVSASENPLWVRDGTGNWIQPGCYPYYNYTSEVGMLGASQGNGTLIPTDDYYQIEPIIMYEHSVSYDPKTIWGELDGVFFCSGFNNGPENVLQIGGGSIVDQTGLSVEDAVNAIRGVAGRAFVLLQNVRFQSWRDFVALEMS